MPAAFHQMFLLRAAIVVACFAQVSAGAEMLQQNCGLNCAYTALRLFGIERTLGDLAASLPVGTDRSQDCSFGELKTLFETHGLSVAGYRADSVAEMLAAVPPGAVAVVRSKAAYEGQSAAHFMLAVPARERMLLIDPSTQQMHALEAGELGSARVLPGATGEFIVITQGAAAPHLSLISQQLELGEIPVTTKVIVAEIPLRNAGSMPLTLSDIKSACGCVERIEGISELAPGECGVIKVHFRKSMLPQGDVMRQVYFTTNDPRNLSVTIPVRMKIKAEPGADEIRLFPREVAYGRMSAAAVIQRAETIKLVIPGDGDAKLAKVSVRSVSADVELRSTHDRPIISPSGDAPSRTLGYELRWKSAPPAGRFERRIELSVFEPGKPLTVMTLEIRGDAIVFAK
ncbi:MAG: DUF1573 domain-containing protein [Burkholderiales bacterium]|nr:DUF1573 domain-containing protein [Phycisphaerae bacterium]